MAKAIKNIELQAFDINEHLNATFLIGGYRQGQAKWIFGRKPKRDFYL